MNKKLVFLMLTILTSVRWNFNVVLICTSLTTKDAEYFFTYLLAICTSFKSHLFNSFAHLSIGLFVLLLFNF
jgi:hypothetical protein